MSNNIIEIQDDEMHARFEATIVRNKKSGEFKLIVLGAGEPRPMRAQSWGQAQVEARRHLYIWRALKRRGIGLSCDLPPGMEASEERINAEFSGKDYKPISEDIRRDIASVVQSVNVIIGLPGGDCIYRAATGHLVLTHLNIPCAIALGGMVFRAGPDPMRDIVAFCGPGNVGTYFDGHFVGHYYICSGPDIIDFSAADWRRIAEQPGSEPDIPGLSKLDSIVWEVEPPPFFWGPRAELFADHARMAEAGGTPELGCAWYTGFDGDNANAQEAVNDAKKTVALFQSAIEHGCEQYQLKERISAI